MLADSFNGSATVAAVNGEPELVDELLKAGVSVYVTDPLRSTALIRVAEATQVNVYGSGHHRCVTTLIARQSKQFFELRNKFRQNAFDLAVKNQSYVALRAMEPGRHPADSEIDKGDAERFRQLKRKGFSDARQHTKITD